MPARYLSSCDCLQWHRWSAGPVYPAVTIVSEAGSMDISLGLQAPGTRPKVLSSNGRPATGVPRLQTSAVFPSPGRRIKLLLVALTVVITAVLSIALGVRGGWGLAWMALMLPIVATILATFLVPIVRTILNQRGRSTAEGVILMTDHAGMVSGEDAQQRVLVHVEHEGDVYWLAATQHGLHLAEGDRVRVSWASARPESCYIHASEDHH